MRLGIEVTGRCNAACAHCSSACGPTKMDNLLTDEICAVMNDAASLGGDDLEFILTGGEPFLDRRRLSALVAHGTGLGAIVGCVSNGFWAATRPRAVQVLAPLRDDGLRLLGISTSRFHRAFVPPQRVEHAIAAAGELGIRTVLKIALTRFDLGQPEIPSLARAAELADEVERFAVIGDGRAPGAINPQEWLTYETIPLGRCPSTEAKVAEDGTFVACCSSSPRSPMFEFGNVRDTPITTCLQALATSPVHRSLRENGPAAFLPAVIKQGEARQLRLAYHDVCDLCSHLLCNPVLADICQRHAEQQYRPLPAASHSL